MGRPIVCNTCCITDEPPDPTDCFGAIGVVFIDESSPGTRLNSKIEKYLAAFPDRLIFIMDVKPQGYAPMQYQHWPLFVSSDRCYSLALEKRAGVSVPEYIKRDQDGFVSDVYSYITTIVNDSAKSSDEVREIWNSATEVSIFRDDSGSMKAHQVEKTYDKLKADIQSNGKIVVSSVYNGREDFICPFVYEQCCINQDAADLIKECLLPECSPAELRFVKHPTGLYVIDDPCDSLLLDNPEGTCSNCPTVLTSNHRVNYTAAAVESNGGILTHIDVDYHLQYRDSSDGTFVDLYDLPDAKSNVEQTFDVLLRSLLCDGSSGSSSAGGDDCKEIDNWELLLRKDGDEVVLDDTDLKGFGKQVTISGDGTYVVALEQLPVSISPQGGSAGKIHTFRREVSIIDDGVKDLHVFTYQIINTIVLPAVHEAHLLPVVNSLEITPDGQKLLVGMVNNGTTGEVRVYSLRTSNNTWVQVGGTITGGSDAIGMGAISSDGKTVLVAGPNAYARATRVAKVFHINNGVWEQIGSNIYEPVGSQRLTHFCTELDISDDGDVIALSAQGYNEHGWVQVYERNTTTNDYEVKGAAFEGTTHSELLGSTLALSPDGNRIAIADQKLGSGNDSCKVYDWNGASWIQKGNSIPRSILEENKERQNLDSRNPHLHFSGCDDILVLGDGYSLESKGLVRVFKLTGENWVEHFSMEGVENDIFGSGYTVGYWGDSACISRTGFYVGSKKFGRTLVFGHGIHNSVHAAHRKHVGAVYFFLAGSDGQPPDDCDKVSCHPLISDMGNPASSCDLFDDTNIGNDCVRRVFRREFRIRASNDAMTSVYSEAFKLYRYVSGESSDDGFWVFLRDALPHKSPAKDNAMQVSRAHSRFDFDPTGKQLAIGDKSTPSVNKGTVYAVNDCEMDKYYWTETYILPGGLGLDNNREVGRSVSFSRDELYPFGQTHMPSRCWHNNPTLAYTVAINDTIAILYTDEHSTNQTSPWHVTTLREYAMHDVRTTSEWGSAIALDGDGDTIAVVDRLGNTSPDDEGKGRLEIYRNLYDDYATGTWWRIGAFTGSAPGTTIEQVSISSNGNIVAWTEPYSSRWGTRSGDLKIWESKGPTKQIAGATPFHHQWVERPISDLGLSEETLLHNIKMSPDGSTFIISSDKGAAQSNEPSELTGWAKVFAWDGTSYRQKGDTFIGEVFGGRFGISSDISVNGNVVAIGSREDNPDDIMAVNAGSVRAYLWNGFSWEQLGQTLRGGFQGADFGYRLVLNKSNEFGTLRLAVYHAYGILVPPRGTIKLYEFEER